MAGLWRAATLAATCWLCCCCDGPPEVVERDRDLLSHLPKHAEQLDVLCARGAEDAVAKAFCVDGVKPTSLRELQLALDLDLDTDDPEQRPGFSLIANSSALPSRSVSALNPGSVIVSLPESDRPLNGNPGKRRSDGNVLAMAYARGDQVVELAVTAAGGADARFYLVRYEQACGDACSNAELFGPQTEKEWTRFSVYDDEDLKNSAFDCLHCHQPEGPGTPRIYRMQEIENPWTHWSAGFTLSGRVLLDDTLRAWGDDDVVAGIPGRVLTQSDPVTAEDLIRFTDSVQPNVFDAPAIEREVQQSSPRQPADNSVPGESETWQLVYDAAVRGEAIPPPHHDVKVTDAARLPELFTAIIEFRNGARGELPDLREVFDEEAAVGMSHRVKPGLDGRGVLVHACAQCHKGKSDAEATKSRFNVLALDEMSRLEKDLAIERLTRPKDDRYLMPPELFRELSPAEIAAAVAALRD